MTEAELENDRRRLRESQERGARQASPAPPPPSEEELKQALHSGGPIPPYIAEHFSRFPPQEIITLSTPRRDANGNIPEVDSRSEADQLKDPVKMLRRIAALETEVAELRGMMKRYFGGAGAAEGEGYR